MSDPLSDARIEFAAQCQRYYRHWQLRERLKAEIREADAVLVEIETKHIGPYAGHYELRHVSVGESYAPHVLQFSRDSAGFAKIKVFAAPHAYSVTLPPELMPPVPPPDQPADQPDDAEIDLAAAEAAVADVADEIAADVLAELTGRPADEMLERVKTLTSGVRDDDEWDPDVRVALAPAGNGSVPTFAFDEGE